MTITAELADGRKLEFPDGTDPSVIQRTVKGLLGEQQQAPAPTATQKVQASGIGRFIQGMRDPIDGAAQSIAHMVPESVTNVLDYFPAKMRNSNSPLLQTIGESFFADPRAKATDQRIADTEKQYEAARTATGQTGFDGARFAGNVASPVNAALASASGTTQAFNAARLGNAAVPTLKGLATTGAVIGGAGGALTPVTNTEGSSFGEQKAAQVGLGAVTGAALTPVLSKVTEAVAPRIAAWFESRFRPEQLGAKASLETDQAIQAAFREIGADIDAVPQAYIKQLRQQVVDSLKSGKLPDVAAMLRQKDFQELGVPALKGQLTRDATTFARERNLRAVPEIGEPLMQTFTTQNQRLQNIIGGYGGRQAAESDVAGSAMAKALADYDEKLRKGVTDAYSAARQSTGKEATVPLQGLAQSYAQVLDDFADKVPAAIRNRFGSFGLDPLNPANQQKIFNVDEADKLLKLINSHVGNDAATNNALGQLRTAVKNAVLEQTDDVFAKGRELASKRFGLHESLPALEQASQGNLSAKNFVSKHIINADTSKVRALSKALSDDPVAFKEARNQIGAFLERAAYGENVTGDKLFSPERYAKALRDLGTEKLKIFFSPQEVSQMQAVSRVGAYINQAPAAAPVLGNPNMAWAGQLLQRIPGVGQGAQLALALGRMARQGADVNASMAAKIPVQPAKPDPDTVRRLAQALAVGTAIAGGAAAK